MLSLANSSNSFLLEMVIAKDHYLSAILNILEIWSSRSLKREESEDERTARLDDKI